MSDGMTTTTPRPVAFYHVAAMNHWREIVSEQLGLLGRCGFDGKIHCGFIGSPYEEGFVSHVAKASGVDIEIRHFGGNFALYEMVTQEWMHNVSQQLDPETPMLYFHGKGVSRNQWQTTMWRWLMNACCLNEWRDCVDRLETKNCVGVSWSEHPGMPAPHFPGNFWWAKAGYVQHLTEVPEYVRQFEEWRKRYGTASWLGKRHAAESWLNSRVDNNPHILGPRTSDFWRHSWWTDPGNTTYCTTAYTQGR